VLGAVVLGGFVCATPALAEPVPSASGPSESAGPSPPATAAGYPWPCEFAAHGRRPAVAPKGPGRKGSLPTIGGENLRGDGLAVSAGSPPPPATVDATSWLVADLDTGQVLGALAAHRPQVPASIQKVLLSATVLSKLSRDRRVEATCEDHFGWGAEPGATDVWLPPGGVYTVDDLFHALLMKSSNDAANALARVAGGDRGTAGTLADMNALAHRIGAWDTHAVTPSGLDPYQLPDELDDDYQVTSAYDMALIFREALKYDTFRQCIVAHEYVLPAQPQVGVGAREFSSRGSLSSLNPGFIYEFPDAIGGKSGYTVLAGHTYVGARERDGRRLVAVVLGIPDPPPSNTRGYQQAAALMDWGFSLPRGTDGVGHLVEPGEADAQIAAKAPPPRSPIVVVPSRSGSSGLLFAAGGGAALVLVAATGSALIWRRRRRLALAAVTASAAGLLSDQAPATTEPLPAASDLGPASADPPTEPPTVATELPTVATELPTVATEPPTLPTEPPTVPTELPPEPPGPYPGQPPVV